MSRPAVPMLLALLLLGCGDGVGGDGGTGPDGGLPDRPPGRDVLLADDVQFHHPDVDPGCDEPGSLGACEDAGLLRWCQNGALRSVDCAALQLGCGVHPELGGAWCLVDRDGDCSRWPCAPPLRCDEQQRCGERADGGA